VPGLSPQWQANPSNYVFASRPLIKGSEWNEENYIDWILDSGCTSATCTKRASRKLRHLRDGAYLGQFETPDGSLSTPQQAGDQFGRIGHGNTVPLVVADVAVQHLYKCNLMPEKVLVKQGITIVNSPRLGKYLILPNKHMMRLREEHGLHYLRVFCKRPEQTLAMTRAQIRARQDGKAGVVDPELQVNAHAVPDGTVSNDTIKIKIKPDGNDTSNDVNNTGRADASSAPNGALNKGSGRRYVKPPPTVVPAGPLPDAEVVRPAAIAILIALHFKLAHANFDKIRNFLELHDLLVHFTRAELRFFRTNIKELCVFCGIAKFTQTQMTISPRAEVSILFPGERVSCDVLGKFVKGIGGMAYSWLFYDWCTTRPRFYPVQHKSEYLKVYKQYQIDTGLRRGARIVGPIRLISDSGSEVLSAEAKDHYRECGTKLTVAPTGNLNFAGRLEGLWSTYIRTMYTVFASNPTMPYKMWVLILPWLAHVLSLVPKTARGKGDSVKLTTASEQETGIKSLPSDCKAQFWAPAVIQNFKKGTDGKFAAKPGRLAHYCGPAKDSPAADLFYCPDTDRVVVAFGPTLLATDPWSLEQELLVAKFAPAAVEALLNPRPSAALPRRKTDRDDLLSVLRPDPALSPPQDLKKLCGQLGFMVAGDQPHTPNGVEHAGLDSTGEPVGGSLASPTQAENSENSDEEVIVEPSMASDVHMPDLNSTLDLDMFDVSDRQYTHTLTPHRSSRSLHLDFGTHCAVKGDQYSKLSLEQLTDRCEAAGLSPRQIVKGVEPSAVLHSINRQVNARETRGLLHRVRKDYEALALRAALINHENGVFANTNVLYGGRGDDSPTYVNKANHLQVPAAVHAIIDDHAKLDVGCNLADDLLQGMGHQTLIKEVAMDNLRREEAVKDVEQSLPPRANRADDSARTHKANVTVEVGRSLREIKRSGNPRYDDHVQAMKDEIEKTKTFEVFEDVLECDITNKEFIVNSILLFAEKYGKENEFIKAKCRLAAQGFSQERGVSYFDSYSATPQDSSWRLMLSLAASHDFECLKQIDWSSAFFLPLLQELVYLRMPPELRQYTWNAVSGKYFEVYKRCRRAIYGLKQSGRKFSELVAADFKKLGYHRSFYDPTVYVKWQRKPGMKVEADNPRLKHPFFDKHMPYSTGVSLATHDVCIVAVHVDDYICVSSRNSMYDDMVSHLEAQYKITHSDLDFYLGMSVERSTKDRTISLGQEALLDKLAEKFDWLAPTAARKTYNVPVAPEASFSKESMPATPCKHRIDAARSMIGTMLYLAMKTRPDLAQATAMMSRVVSNPSEDHIAAMKQLCVYAYNTRKQKLVFRGRNHVPGSEDVYYAFADSDYNNADAGYKATSGYAIYHNHNLIDWKSKLQSTISRSTCQAELAALSFVSSQIIHLRYLIQELGLPMEHATVIREDNKAAVFATENDQMSRRLGHLMVAELFCRRAYQLGMTKAMPIRSEHNVADVFTKACAKVKFAKHKDQLFNGPKY